MTKKMRQQREMLARRLANNGVPLTVERDDEDAGPLMWQTGGLLENCAFDLKSGIAGFIVNMGITIKESTFAVADILLELPWTDRALSLIKDPLESGAQNESYQFPGNDTLAFGREVVINHFVNMQRLLPKGKTIEGLLLWVGSESIPDAFVHGASFPATVVVIDQYNNHFPYEATLWSDRSGRRVRDKVKERSRTPLFARRDVVPL
jgi:hypothetical protein